MDAKITKDSTHAEVQEHWAKALESGEYAQSTDQLARADGYCCLSVGCVLAVHAGVIEDFDGDHPDLEEYPSVRK